MRAQPRISASRYSYGGTDTLINIHSVIGSVYADMLFGASGAADTFDGRGGGDRETGQGGGDAFIFNQGYGQLEINESNAATDPGNTLRLGAGIDPAQVQVASDTAGTGVVLSTGLAGDQVTLDNMQTGPGMGVQSVRFADGTSWSATHVLSLLPSAVSLAGLAPDQAVPVGDGSALRPFAALVVADSNPHQQEETATATLSGTGGAFSDLGTGQLNQDGLTYTATGSAAAVQADLQELLFTPSSSDASDGTATIGLTLSNPGGGSASNSVSVALQAAGSPPASATILYGMSGGSALPAAAGPDLFVFQGAAFGNEAVSGFNPAQDAVQLSRAQFADFAAVQGDLSAAPGGGGALITLDGADSILLQGVNPASLQAGNFRFA